MIVYIRPSDTVFRYNATLPVNTEANLTQSSLYSRVGTGLVCDPLLCATEFVFKKIPIILLPKAGFVFNWNKRNNTRNDIYSYKFFRYFFLTNEKTLCDSFLKVPVLRILLEKTKKLKK